MARVRVQEAAFDAGIETAALTAGRRDVGAVATFIGFVRDANEGDAVQGMTLEHYPGMTEKALEAICDEAHQRAVGDDGVGAVVERGSGRGRVADRRTGVRLHEAGGHLVHGGEVHRNRRVPFGERQRVEPARAQDGGMDVRVRGAMFDAAPFMDVSSKAPTQQGPSAQQAEPPLRADVAVDRLRLRGDAMLLGELLRNRCNLDADALGAAVRCDRRCGDDLGELGARHLGAEYRTGGSAG